MKESPLRSSAVRAISSVERTISLVKSGLSSAVDPAEQERLSRLLEKAGAVLADSRVERDIVTAGEKQLTAVEAFFQSVTQPVEKRPYKEFAVIGGNRCLGPDTVIDSPEGPRPVSEINGKHLVYTWNGERAVIIMADAPYIKAHEPCYRITLSNGKWFDCSGSHRVLTNNGYMSVSHIIEHQKPVNTHFVGADGKEVWMVMSEPLGEKPIYDFNVPVYHNYVAAGVVHHNSGKSFTGRIITAKWIRDIAPKGAVVWCIAPEDSVSIRGQQKELWEALPRSMFGDAMYDERNGFGGRSNTVVLEPDNRRVVVRFKTEAQYRNNPRSFEQEKVSLIWIDESLGEEAYKALRPRTVDLGAPMVLTCIPDQPWIFDEFENAKPGSRRFFLRIAMMDNHHLPESEILDAATNWSDEEKAVRLYGNFRFLSGIVYKEFVKEYAPVGHIVRPFAIPADWPKFRALDWGNAHPTACLWMAVAPNETYYIYREYVMRYASVEKHAKAILELSGSEKYEKPLIIDPACYSRNQANAMNVAGEFERYGLKCTPAVRTNAVGEQALVNRVKARLEARTVCGPMLQVFDRCEHLIWEFRRWKYKMAKDGKPTPSDGYEDKDNDACFAAGTTVDTDHGPVAIENVRPGMTVRSLAGWTRVVVGGTKTGRKATIRVCLDDGTSVSCTPDHRFYFGDGSPIRAEHLLGVQPCKSTPLSGGERKPCNTSSMEGSGGIAIPAQADSSASISDGRKPKAAESRPLCCTDRFTSTTSDSLRPDYTSTTLTETAPTTTRQTSWQSRRPVMQSCTRSLQQKGGCSQENGTHPKRDSGGTSRTPKTSGETNNQKSTSVAGAGLSLCQQNHTANEPESFVAACAGRQQGGRNARISSRGNASSAERLLSQTNTTTLQHAQENAGRGLVSSIEPAGVCDVYCIATENGTFSVAGLAVKNCDALKYLIAANTGMMSVRVHHGDA